MMVTNAVTCRDCTCSVSCDNIAAQCTSDRNRALPVTQLSRCLACSSSCFTPILLADTINLESYTVASQHLTVYLI